MHNILIIRNSPVVPEIRQTIRMVPYYVSIVVIERTKNVVHFQWGSM